MLWMAQPRVAGVSHLWAYLIFRLIQSIINLLIKVQFSDLEPTGMQGKWQPSPHSCPTCSGASADEIYSIVQTTKPILDNRLRTIETRCNIDSLLLGDSDDLLGSLPPSVLNSLRNRKKNNIKQKTTQRRGRPLLISWITYNRDEVLLQLVSLLNKAL